MKMTKTVIIPDESHDGQSSRLYRTEKLNSQVQRQPASDSFPDFKSCLLNGWFQAAHDLCSTTTNGAAADLVIQLSECRLSKDSRLKTDSPITVHLLPFECWQTVCTECHLSETRFAITIGNIRGAKRSSLKHCRTHHEATRFD